MFRPNSRILAGAVSLGLLISTAAGAETACSSPADQAAFDVGALKSELTVLAIACHDQDDYNRFVERYRGELVNGDSVVNGWFKRNYGRTAQSRYDSYITSLANEQANAGQHQGSDFCPRLKVVFSEVMALPDPKLIAQYAAAKDVIPSGAGSCELPTQVAESPRGRSSSAATRKHR